MAGAICFPLPCFWLPAFRIVNAKIDYMSTCKLQCNIHAVHERQLQIEIGIYYLSLRKKKETNQKV